MPPPRLERPPAPGAPAAPAGAAPPPPRAAPGAGNYGMAAREVSPEAAIAAGLALSGSLELASTLRLFGLAAASQANGELSVSTEGRTVTYMLFFRRGTVEHAGSSDPADDLGRFLLRKGILTPEKLVQAEAAKGAAGGDLLGALIATRLVNPGEVAALLAERGNAVVARALACEAGSFAWEPGVPPPPSSFPLGSPFGSLCAAVRALDVAAVQRRLGDRGRGSASPTAGRAKLEDLRLTPQEARAVGLFDGARSPEEIAAAQPAEAGMVLRLALLLGEMDLLAFGPPRAPRADAAPPPPAPARAAPPAPAATPAPVAPARTPAPAAPPRPAAPAAPRPAVDPARPAPAPAARSATTPAPRPAAAAAPAAPLDVAALRALLEKHKGADHFQVLGVKRDAPASAVKAAYFQLARTYHPDTVPADASAELRKLCGEVFTRVGEAWAILGEDAERASYLEELKSGGAADVDVMRILHAENVFGEATALMKARRYADGLAKLEEAVQLNPDEAEFAIWKAWCEFLLAADKKRQHPASAAAIEAALKKNAKCGPGYQFLGQMAKLLGDLGQAERHLKRGLQALPDNTDLARELKYLRR